MCLKLVAPFQLFRYTLAPFYSVLEAVYIVLIGNGLPNTGVL